MYKINKIHFPCYKSYVTCKHLQRQDSSLTSDNSKPSDKIVPASQKNIRNRSERSKIIITESWHQTTQCLQQTNKQKQNNVSPEYILTFQGIVEKFCEIRHTETFESHTITDQVWLQWWISSITDYTEGTARTEKSAASKECLMFFLKTLIIFKVTPQFHKKNIYIVKILFSLSGIYTKPEQN